ncbi:MAG: methyltransferase domain-containing protein [Acidobacteriota bacterium]
MSTALSAAQSGTLADARALKRRWLVKTGRRLISAVVRRRVGVHPWPDDRRNFWALLTSSRAQSGVCPLCGWRGVFLQHAGRPRQVCLVCGSRARHRSLQLAVSERVKIRAGRALHIAPEKCLAPLLRGHDVVTGDLEPGHGEVALDLRQLPFADGSFDLVLASHVFEHIVEDDVALAEVHRVLRPGGQAILPVPITAERTVDFGFVDPARNHHARECGPDYVERYRRVGFTVDEVGSRSLPDPRGHALLTAERGGETEHHIPFCTKPAGAD